MKTKYWLMAIGFVLAVCLGLSLLLMRPTEDAVYAQVLLDGKVIHTLDLRFDREVVVRTEKGTNVITVRNGKVAVTEATCPDHVCVNRGFCSGGMPIACVPNSLVIRFLGEQETDGAAG